jgi:hypothetical protein
VDGRQVGVGFDVQQPRRAPARQLLAAFAVAGPPEMGDVVGPRRLGGVGGRVAPVANAGAPRHERDRRRNGAGVADHVTSIGRGEEATAVVPAVAPALPRKR